MQIANILILTYDLQAWLRRIAKSVVIVEDMDIPSVMYGRKLYSDLFRFTILPPNVPYYEFESGTYSHIVLDTFMDIEHENEILKRCYAPHITKTPNYYYINDDKLQFS